MLGGGGGGGYLIQRMPWKEHRKVEVGPSRGALVYQTFDWLNLVNSILYPDPCITDQKQKRLVLPSRYIHEVLKSLSSEVGHPGRHRTMSLLWDRFYWPGMSNDVNDWK